CFSLARYPTAARTPPPCALVAPPGVFTTTSVTTLANSQRPNPFLPAQSPVGSFTLTKDRPASLERYRPWLVATYTTFCLRGLTATWYPIAPSGTPEALCQCRPRSSD